LLDAVPNSGLVFAVPSRAASVYVPGVAAVVLVPHANSRYRIDLPGLAGDRRARHRPQRLLRGRSRDRREVLRLRRQLEPRVAARQHGRIAAEVDRALDLLPRPRLVDCLRDEVAVRLRAQEPVG
jgi:hypothetical protein